MCHKLPNEAVWVKKIYHFLIKTSIIVLVNPRKSYGTKKQHNKKGYSSNIILKSTLQKNYVHRKNFKHKVIRKNYLFMWIWKGQLSKISWKYLVFIKWRLCKHLFAKTTYVYCTPNLFYLLASLLRILKLGKGTWNMFNAFDFKAVE